MSAEEALILVAGRFRELEQVTPEFKPENDKTLALAKGWLSALEARAKWAEDVARPALEYIEQRPVDARRAKQVARHSLATYPQPEQESRP